MDKIKEFGVLKWLVFPSLSLALGAIIAYVNIRVFGGDGWLYTGIVAVIVAFSIAINKYVSASNSKLAIAAFVFEILLSAALLTNAAYSLSIQRGMSVARMTEESQSKDLETATKLKSRAAQRDVARMVKDERSKAKSAQSIFAENERPLFWLMVAETIAYMVSAFTLYALSHLVGRKDNQLGAEIERETRQTVYAPSVPTRSPLVRPMSADAKKGDKPKGNGPDSQHIGSAGVLD